jgi:endoglucanase
MNKIAYLIIFALTVWSCSDRNLQTQFEGAGEKLEQFDAGQEEPTHSPDQLVPDESSVAPNDDSTGDQPQSPGIEPPQDPVVVEPAPEEPNGPVVIEPAPKEPTKPVVDEPTPEEPVVVEPEPEKATFAQPQTDPNSPVHFRYNQLGYLPLERKLIVLMSKSAIKQALIKVETSSELTLQSISVGTAEAVGMFQAQELEIVTSGMGLLQIQVGNNISSTIEVSDHLHQDLLEASMSFFKANRCGSSQALHHGQCHMKPARKTTNENVDLSGGWHDAGDYIKFLATAGHSANLLFTSAILLEDSQIENQTVIDEALWGAAWVKKLWDKETQTLYYQVGDYSDHTEWRLPDGDDSSTRTQKAYAVEPGKGANVGGKATSTLAFAAYFLKKQGQPTLAQNYITTATEIYQWAKTRTQAQSATDGFYDEYNYKDDMALAAVALYLVTQNSTYQREAKQYIEAAGNGWHFDYGNSHPLAMFHMGRIDQSFKSQAIALLKSEASNYDRESKGNLFGQSNTKFYWGSATAMSGAALTMGLYQIISGDETFQNSASQQKHFILGKNQWGVAWVNSIGHVWSENPHHQIADLKNVELVGFWNEGPLPKSDWEALNINLTSPDSYSSFQTDQAVYHDSVVDYATNEPTIVGNATGVALTSFFLVIENKTSSMERGLASE